MPALTPEQEMLKKAALAATPGPWLASEAYADNGEFSGVDIHAQDGTVLLSEDSGPGAKDATFIAAANPAAILDLLARLEAAQPMSDVLFNGNAVYEEITRKLGKGHCISAEAVSATLDAVVRLIRAAKAAPGEPGQ